MRVPIPHANDENDDAFQRPAPVMSKKRTRPVSSSASPSETMLGNAQRPAIGATPLAIDRTPVHASTGIDSRPPPSTGSRHRKQVQVRALTDLLLNVFVESHSNANSELAVEVADEEQVEDKSRNNSDTTEREPTNDDTIIEQNTATMFQPIVQAEVGTVPADTHPPPADVLPPTTIVVEQEAAGSDIYDFDPLLEHITLSQQCTVAGCEGSPTPPSRSQSSASQPECVSRFRPTPFGVNDTEYADQNVTEVCAPPVATGTTVDDLDDFPLDPGMEKAMASSQAMLDESAQDGESCHALKQQSLAPSPPAATTADSPTKTGLRRHQTMPAVQTPVRTHTAGHESHAIQVCRKTASDGGSDYGDFNMDLESAELLNVLSQCDVVAASNNDSVSPTTLLQQQKQQQVQSHPLPEISNTDPTADHRDAPAQLEMTNIDDPYDNDDDSFFKNPELEQILDQANSANNATG